MELVLFSVLQHGPLHLSISIQFSSAAGHVCHVLGEHTADVSNKLLETVGLIPHEKCDGPARSALLRNTNSARVQASLAPPRQSMATCPVPFLPASLGISSPAAAELLRNIPINALFLRCRPGRELFGQTQLVPLGLLPRLSAWQDTLSNDVRPF